MQIKTALIILAILTILSGLFMVYLFKVEMKPLENNLVSPKYISPTATSDITTATSDKEKSSQDNLIKEEKRQEMIKILEQEKENNPDIMTREEKEKLRRELLKSLDK